MFKKMMAASALAVGAFGVSLGVATPALADTNGATTTDIPILPAVTPNPCNGDQVSYSGEAHLVLHETVNNNTVHLMGHFTFQVDGMDADGTAYVGNGSNIEYLNMAAGSTQSQVERFIFISKGSDPNFAATGHYHVTVDANGNVTASFDRLDLDCNG